MPDSFPSGENRPLVTVGIPVYNGAHRLAEALESVLAQDYGNIELVISDNASKDETQGICLTYARSDRRIRYLRNGSNIGFLPNFRRVLEEARGAYFTWLAHDDLLSNPSYLRTVVEYMENHRDVVACATAFYLLDNELPGSVSKLEFPELHPDRWPGSRRALLRWPRSWLDACIYGVFRREALQRVRIPQRTYRGRPHIFCWEADVLTALSGFGRVVALPDCLRSYRLSTVSVGQRIGEVVSSFDLLVLGIELKLFLLRRAMAIPMPAGERMGVVATALANLLRANFRQPYDQRVVLRSRQRELGMLLGVADERSKLISFLREEISTLRKADGSRVDEPEPDDDEGGAAAPLSVSRETSRARQLIGEPSRRRLALDFFRPLSSSELGKFHEMNEHIGKLRIVCDEQLKIIDQLHTDAAALKKRLGIVEADQRRSRA